MALDPALARAARAVTADTTRRDKSVTARDEIILRASADGASLREIAEVAGITHVAVKNILDRRRAGGAS